jgi:hypothetical protein
MVPLLLSAIFSLKAFRLKWPASLKVFSVLLWVMVFFEAVNIIWKYWLHSAGALNYSNNTHWLDNISIICQCLLYFWFYSLVFRTTKWRRFLSPIFAVSMTFLFINWTFGQGFMTLNSLSLVFMDIILVIFAFFYFENLKSDNVVAPLSRQPLLWISLGSFLAHTAGIPFILTAFSYVRIGPVAITAFYFVYQLLYCLMFIFYSIAFLCQNPKQK